MISSVYIEISVDSEFLLICFCALNTIYHKVQGKASTVKLWINSMKLIINFQRIWQFWFIFEWLRMTSLWTSMRLYVCKIQWQIFSLVFRHQIERLQFIALCGLDFRTYFHVVLISAVRHSTLLFWFYRQDSKFNKLSWSSWNRLVAVRNC